MAGANAPPEWHLRRLAAAAERQDIEIELPAMPVRPVELFAARALSDDADDDLTIPDADLPAM